VLKSFLRLILGDLVWERIGQAKQEFEYRKLKYHCEEALIPIFQRYFYKENGFYVDVGANDGRSVSNTYDLEKTKNWGGILIEPIMHVHFRSRQIRSLEKNKFVNCALVSQDYQGETIKLFYSGLMTVMAEGSEFKPKNWANVGSQFLSRGEIVQTTWSSARTLDSVLSEFNAPRRIDLLSIDVEGSEMQVLNGTNFSKYVFEYILIETDVNSKAFKFLTQKGYHYLESVNQNILFAHQSLLDSLSKLER